MGSYGAVANVLSRTSKRVVVLDVADELREVVAVPFAHAHGEGVDVLVELVEERNRLDDHVVLAPWVELDFAPAVRVAEAKLRLLHIPACQLGRAKGAG